MVEPSASSVTPSDEEDGWMFVGEPAGASVAATAAIGKMNVIYLCGEGVLSCDSGTKVSSIVLPKVAYVKPYCCNEK